MKRWPFVIAVLMLTSTWVLLLLRLDAEPALTRKAFAGFPLSIADRWQGRELGLEKDILDVLRLTDYMMRLYAPRDQHSGGTPIWLYAGYYQSQRTGATYHSPKNCLPGAGWQVVYSEQSPVLLRNGETVTINKVLIQKGLEKEAILYWYQDRGRIIASEYWAKFYLVWDAITRNRTDGALIRISVPVVQSSEQAFTLGVEFLQEMFPLLDLYLPA